MKTNIFHVFTVTPIDVFDYELPAVEYGEIFVAAPNSDAAYEYTKHLTVDATEVFVGKRPLQNGILIHPKTELVKRETLQHHRHWSKVQKGYKLLARGAESPEQFVMRRFGEKYPHLA